MSDLRTLLSFACRIHPGDFFPQLGRRIKYIFRLLLNRKNMLDYYRFFSESTLAAIVKANPRLLEKPCKPYLYCGAKAQDKFGRIKQHYAIALQNFSAEEVQAIVANGYYRLFDITLDEYPLQIALFSGTQIEMEGEFGLGLFNKDNTRIYSLTFSLNKNDTSDIQLVIGGLQGPAQNGDDGKKDFVRDLTKSAHGLRPKDLLIYLLRQLATFYGAKTILAVKSEAHIYQCHISKRKRIKTDYNQYWEELKGTVYDSNFYQIPLQYQEKDINDIPAKKRSMYRKRYALMDDLRQSLAHWHTSRKKGAKES